MQLLDWTVGAGGVEFDVKAETAEVAFALVAPLCPLVLTPYWLATTPGPEGCPEAFFFAKPWVHWLKAGRISEAEAARMEQALKVAMDAMAKDLGYQNAKTCFDHIKAHGIPNS